jgi:hypothetical protein
LRWTGAPPPRDQRSVPGVVVRAEGGRRQCAERVAVDPDHGVVGDAWARRVDCTVEEQIAVMEADVARLITNDQPLALF